MQDIKINQLKLEVHDTYKKDYKITTDFELIDNSDVINKSYLDENMKNLDGHFSYIQNDYDQFKSEHNKQSVEDFLSQRAVKTTTRILYDKELFDNYSNADKVLEDFFLQQDLEVIYHSK